MSFSLGLQFPLRLKNCKELCVATKITSSRIKYTDCLNGLWVLCGYWYSGSPRTCRTEEMEGTAEFKGEILKNSEVKSVNSN